MAIPPAAGFKEMFGENSEDDPMVISFSVDEDEANLQTRIGLIPWLQPFQLQLAAPQPNAAGGGR